MSRYSTVAEASQREGGEGSDLVRRIELRLSEREQIEDRGDDSDSVVPGGRRFELGGSWQVM